ncbi:Ni/Co efflux regulator RcnB [Rhizobium sp. BK196]|jgi:Ni/Co efflux regulator RcnB|uniref:RcnB family protein n=1 Tax=unclassified Rhizobium TaxID=2613769 RepID=UPI0016140005|nr:MULTISPECIES: RcnB family protein [unclassified Rhizobium]MBB3308864.1 Ni/Co efflux regulator RcnB [Rhizobium sp. BK196]MBB3461695.1 Ni/Co efflux regulator RcnB [Rhizobium sp. BK377]
MKKIFAALLSASFLLSPIVASEASAADHRRPPVVVHKKVVVEKKVVRRHHWSRGYRMSAAERGRYGEVRDYRRYRLAPPPRGYHWVKADNDYLLVGVATGLISSIVAANR